MVQKIYIAVHLVTSVKLCLKRIYTMKRYVKAKEAKKLRKPMKIKLPKLLSQFLFYLRFNWYECG